MNPLDLLDSILSDWVSPRVRRLLHTLILIGAALASIWLASDGDWKDFTIAVVSVLYAASNRANTPAIPEGLDEHGLDVPKDDNLSYEEAGGNPYEEDSTLFDLDESSPRSDVSYQEAKGL